MNLAWLVVLLLWFLGSCLAWEFLCEGRTQGRHKKIALAIATVLWPMGVVLRIAKSLDWRRGWKI
jgi:hypothetical protein